MEIRKMYLVIVSIIALLSLIAFCVLFFHGGYDDKILSKLGLKEPKPQKNWTVFSWDNSLKQLHYDSDIAFFGDSLTQGGDFQKRFPDKKIINLGCGGDSIVNLMQRVSMLKHTSPKKVFIMVGINGLTNTNTSASLESYEKLLNSVEESLPETKVYVQSILPVSEEKEKELFCSNTTIEKFNEELKKLCEEKNIEYIDLHSIFVENSQIKKKLTYDGLHVNTSGYETWMNAIEPFVK